MKHPSNNININISLILKYLYRSPLYCNTSVLFNLNTKIVRNMKYNPCLQNDNKNTGNHTILKITLNER